METHTATIGVRGSNWYTLLSPNATGVYLPAGILGVSSNLPTVWAWSACSPGNLPRFSRADHLSCPRP